MRLSRNLKFLRAAIYKMAEDAYKSEVIDTEMENAIIGEGEEFESKNDWINSHLEFVFSQVSKNIISFPDTGQPPSKAEFNNSEKFYRLILGMEISIGNSKNSIVKVPGGWVFISRDPGTVSNCFVPYNDEYIGLIEEDLEDESS